MTRAELVAEARKWIGTPYHAQASTCGVGADCGGMHRGIARAFALPWPGIPEPHATILLAPDWYYHTTEELFKEAFAMVPCLAPVPLEQIGPGDTLLFGWGTLPCSHAALVTETVPQFRFLHALFRRQVLEQPMDAKWRRLIRCAYTLNCFEEE